MRILALVSLALSTSVAAALLAACSGSQLPIGAPDAMPLARTFAPTHLTVRRRTSSYRVLYSFGGYAKDGIEPQAGLIGVDGTLYGTTRADSTRICGEFSICGTVFSITTGGAEKVLHTFGKGTDGYSPHAGLIDVDGTLYGTTPYGGTAGDGVVFSITTGGKEKVLYSFGGGVDGATPEASLIDVNGTLYGTTRYGGGGNCHDSGGTGCGTVYSVSTSGVETVLHSFTGVKGDGAHPAASLIDVRGKLYGTTLFGGKGQLGTVFRISTTGEEHVLHSFYSGAGSSEDGAVPAAALLDVNGVLYGTTQSGGYYHDGTGGTVFSITTTGKEHVIHDFGSGNDGIGPLAALVEVSGTLYGTTESGGEYQYGSIFSISTTGEEHVLHSFGGSPDGARPFADLISVNGTLYGTTYFGGAYGGASGGDGTVFWLTP